MLDLDAPIRPGEGAAGLALGSLVQPLLATLNPESVVELHDCTKYDFGVVHVWVKEGKVYQVGVYKGYRGALDRAIRIGSTIAEIEVHFSRHVEEDDDDNLVVPGVPGWCFETEDWVQGRTLGENRNACVSEIYVFGAAV